MSAVYGAVDVGGTTISCGLGTSEGRFLYETTIPTASSEGPQRVLARIGSTMRELAEHGGLQPAAIGVGLPGLIDVALGITRFLPNMSTSWADILAAEILRSETGCPVYLLNDARLATLGELEYGWGRSIQTMVFLTLGTGIGGGLVIDRKLRLGPLDAAGELGHQTIVPDGPMCGCGNRGCLEAVASGPAITAEGVRLMLAGNASVLYALCEGDAGRVNPRTMAEAARAGDVAVQFAIERAGKLLGIGLANLITALHPEMCVLAGGVSGLGDLILEPVRATVLERVRMFPANTVRIERSQLGDKAGLLGGLALAARQGLK